MENSNQGFRIFEDILKCKWTLCILDRLTNGDVRPGQLKRNIRGLTAKVMYERLKKLEKFGIIERDQITEKPLEVHYILTSNGKKVSKIINKMKKIEF